MFLEGLHITHVEKPLDVQPDLTIRTNGPLQDDIEWGCTEVFYDVTGVIVMHHMA